jgi:ABC-type nitrate/sulfonate/bicarbonate transport system permease component
MLGTPIRVQVRSRNIIRHAFLARRIPADLISRRRRRTPWRSAAVRTHTYIELPLAIPIMLTGIRTALIIVVGTAALATFINAGGMGDIINTGIKTSREPILIAGSVLTAVLALGVDYLAGIAEDVLKPKGL